MNKSISVVIPVYNSENSLHHLAERLLPTLKHLEIEFEVILVNDDSRDQSWSVIEDLSKKHPWIYGINLMRNFGQHNAILCGVRAARFALIATLDDDLQHPPEEIEKLIQKINEGWDVVYGIPAKAQHSIARNFASRMTKLALQHAMGAKVACDISAFRVFRTQLRNSFANCQSPYVSLDVLLTWGTTRFTAVSVRHDNRYEGKTNYTFKKLFIHALNMITGFSTWPLQAASWLGFALTAFGVLILLFVLERFFLNHSAVPGFTFLAAIIVIFSGAQLFTLGMIGEYLGRIYSRTMERPVYSVRSTTQNFPISALDHPLLS